ncbi:MAG: hypothetical protein WED11_06845, partial [Natronospirillum sp.]
DLLPDLPDAAVDDITQFYTEAVNGGVFPTDGGQPSDVIDDLQFLSAAGQVAAPGDDVDVSRYWDFGPLDAARD